MQIKNRMELSEAVLQLEARKLMQEELLISQFKTTRESLSPGNLIKEGFQKLTNITDMPGNILKTVAGIGVGLLSKKLFLGRSNSLVKKLLSGVFEVAVAKSAISHADKIKAYGVSIYHNLFKKAKHNGQMHKNTIVDKSED